MNASTANEPAHNEPAHDEPAHNERAQSGQARSGQTRRRRSLRWLRLVVPPGLVLLVIALSGLAYWLEQPDVTDRAYLSPTSGADVGGSQLARRLTDRGIRVDRVTKVPRALNEAARGDVTLFVPTPSLVHPDHLAALELLPASTRIVLVAPDSRTLSDADIAVKAASRRLAARAAEPGASCRYGPAMEAGRAAVQRTRYRSGGASQRCYGDALIVVSSYEREVTIVGADDPFRNDRIAEHHNAALATGLLAAQPRVIWLDLHRLDPGPQYAEPSSEPTPGDADGDYSRTASGQPRNDSWSSGDGERRGSGAAGDSDDSEASKQAQDDEESPNPLWKTFPAWVFAASALVVLALVLLALHASRRLGGPVSEPLPITVRATETVEGRGRLYQRAKARAASIGTLRATAAGRLVRLLDLPGDADRAVIVAACAAHSGWTPEAVDRTLFGPEPADDRELVRAALAIERLLQAVTHRSAPPTVAPEGEPR